MNEGQQKAIKEIQMTCDHIITFSHFVPRSLPFKPYLAFMNFLLWWSVRRVILMTNIYVTLCNEEYGIMLVANICLHVSQARTLSREEDVILSQAPENNWFRLSWTSNKVYTWGWGKGGCICLPCLWSYPLLLGCRSRRYQVSFLSPTG